ncbi:MAG TPA: UDP-N-acetylmuramoyl-L-alanine--D-glutamate ligase [Acidaminococcaceae bacterium]|nr:UDP-N-acetylmuramoyl-L-alanine--D-glutamate ligase [Acidaminococcaceae bacterium]
MEKKLQALLDLLPEKVVSGNPDKVITDITIDSRTVQPGSLFVALKGVHTDGQRFLGKAARAGAAAALVEDVPADAPADLTFIRVPDVRKAMETVTPFFYDYPGKTMRMIGVTGTNGKTTSTNIIRRVLMQAGYKCGLIGTINVLIGDEALTSHNTTPDVADLQKFLYRMKEAGCQYVVMEVSSHALALNRVAGIEYDTAMLTNITEDHLNRHGTMEVYTEMKMRMFARQTPEDFAVFNADDPGLRGLSRQVRSRVLKFSRKKEVREGAFVRDGEIVLRLNGEERTVCRTEEVRIPGPHNLENALGAVCCAGIMEVPVPVIRHTLKTFRGVEHRIESVRVLDGVEYFNDSKGTNVDSTLKAIETMTRPTVLILGGYDKHVSFDPLSREIMERKDIIRETVLIGETAGQIEESLLRAGYDHIQHAETLREAVVLCRQTAEEGWNVLLSPACASFDMFKDYEERGRIFKKIVAEL